MKLKKVLLILISILMLFSILFVQGKSYAATTTETLYVRRASYRSGHFGYSINNPVNASNGGAQTIWNLLSMKNSSGTEYYSGNEDGYHTLYCLDITKWMGNKGRNETTTNTVTYNQKYNMDNEYTNSIKSKFSASPFINESNYNSLLWLMDNIYIPNDPYYKNNESEKKTDKIALLKAAGITSFVQNGVTYYTIEGGDIPESELMTDDDIEAVQQAVIWRYTVNDSSEEKLKNTLKNDNLVLYYTQDGNTYNPFSNIKYSEESNSSGISARDKQAVTLYKYLITEADKAGNAKYTSAIDNPITVNKGSFDETIKESNNKYIVGPISITKQGNNCLPYNIDLQVTDGNGNNITNYYFSNENGDKLYVDDNNHKECKNIEDLIGKDNFYITVTNTSVQKVKVKINTSYRTTEKYIWSNTTASTEYQPLAEPKISKHTNTVEVEATKKIIKTGQYKLVLEKQDEKGNKLNQPVTFNVAGPNIQTEDKQFTGELTIAENVEITEENLDEVDVYTLKETVAPEGYNMFGGTITVTVVKLETDTEYMVKSATCTVADDTGKDITSIKKDDIGVDIDAATKTIKIKVKDHKVDGKYDLVLIKEDAYGNQLNKQATFKVTGPNISQETQNVTGRLTIAQDVQIQNTESQDIYTIEEITAPDKYCKFNGKITVKVNKKQEGDKYLVQSVDYEVKDKDGKDIKDKSGVTVTLDANGNIYVKVPNYQFDLKLLKFITAVNDEKVDNRVKSVDVSKLNKNGITTGDYKLVKDPVPVQNGDYVTYTFRVYNEGDIAGYAQEITENIPTGLEYVWDVNITTSNGEVNFDNVTGLTDEDKKAIKFNLDNGWGIVKDSYDATNNRVTEISTKYLSKETNEDNLINAYNANLQYLDTETSKNPDYKEVSVMLKVIAENDLIGAIRNEAAITDDADSDGNKVIDRDSTPEDWNKENSDKYYDEDQKWHIYEEDDEDYDNIILKQFDLALRKQIVQINDTLYANRFASLSQSKENTLYNYYDVENNKPSVKAGDIVTYSIRVYNEGEIDGYANLIVDTLPSGLEFYSSEYNDVDYGWKPVAGVADTYQTDYLSYTKDVERETKGTDNSTMLEKYSGTGEADYKDIYIVCKVKDNVTKQDKLLNVAQIADDADDDGKEIYDIDSIPGNQDRQNRWQIEDDLDIEDLKLKVFDLALRKFITAVGTEEVTTRVPEPKIEDGQITYEHTKEPVLTKVGDVVTYTIRVYNEGEIKGYAQKVSDDIPEYLEYLPENEINKEYRWVMYDKDEKETTNVSEAVKITTDYLSKENGEELMKDNSDLTENPNLLKAFDGENLDYRDVKVAFKVEDPNSSTTIITNKAQISEDSDENGNSVDDLDSTPDKWIEGEDDQDEEHVKVHYFDLSLKKFVTKVITIENGTEKVEQTGHTGDEDPEPVVKVELHRKKLSDIKVKFGYTIKITNEGDVAGYAKEITDYVPEGLKFDANDNKDWKDEGNNVISTRLLENTLLQPGESASVEVILTWINGENNIGLKTNTAEISEDYNDEKIPDRDSIPDNKKPKEDDIDDAEVILSIETGQEKIYYVLGFSILITLASGIVIVKKFIM